MKPREAALKRTYRAIGPERETGGMGTQAPAIRALCKERLTRLLLSRYVTSERGRLRRLRAGAYLGPL